MKRRTQPRRQRRPRRHLAHVLASTSGHLCRFADIRRSLGDAVGFVPPLERLSAGQISPQCLPQDERIEIAALRRAGSTVRRIAHRLDAADDDLA